jgi:hypothetical protein
VSSQTARFCEECGYRLSPEAKFCGGCGRPLSAATSEPGPPEPPAVADRDVVWGSLEDEVDLDDYPYAQSASGSFLAGALMLGAIMSTDPAAFGDSAPPMTTTWTFDRDAAAGGRVSEDQLGTLGQVFGGFVRSSGLLDAPWDAFEVVTPLGNRGLVMVTTAAASPDSAQVRLVVPLAYGIDVRHRDRAQIQSSIDWLLSKVESPYMSYVPLVENDAQRGGLVEDIIARSGTVVPGPLSDMEWLTDPYVSAVGSHPAGFPGVGTLRLGMLDEQRCSRQRAVFRGDQLELQTLDPGTVDVYVGWQIGLDGVGLLGLMAIGHRSLMAMIDLVVESPEFAAEFDGVAPSA